MGCWVADVCSFVRAYACTCLYVCLALPILLLLARAEREVEIPLRTGISQSPPSVCLRSYASAAGDTLHVQFKDASGWWYGKSSESGKFRSLRARARACVRACVSTHMLVSLHPAGASGFFPSTFVCEIDGYSDPRSARQHWVRAMRLCVCARA